MNNLLGAKQKLITGYPGGADISLAMQRNELDGRCGWSLSSIRSTAPTWIRDNKISFTLQHALKKHPDLQTIPLITDLVSSKRDKQALKVHLAPQAYGRPFAVGPKVPEDRFKALRAAFWKTMKDPEFLADAKKRKMPIRFRVKKYRRWSVRSMRCPRTCLLMPIRSVIPVKGRRLPPRSSLSRLTGARSPR